MNIEIANDARIQQIVNVTPILTLVHVSSTCFQGEIQNYSNFKNSRVQGINK